MYTFRNSGLEGAGFNNVIAVDPFDSNNLVIGCDVAGFHYSTARGGAWTTGNRGLSLLSQAKVAAIKYSSTTQGKVYAATGNKGAGGGFLVSVDGGRSWEIRSTTPQFSGGNTGTLYPLPTPHPRSTGDLIAVDATGGRIYVGTFVQGLMRSDDDGVTWPVTVSFGAGVTYIRTIAIDPSDASKVYVGTYSKKAWLVTAADTGSPVATQLTNAPDDVEAFSFVGGTLYAACGGTGIYTVTADGSTWTAINNGIDTAGSKWMSVAGHVVGPNHTLYAGCAFPQKIPQGGGIAFAKSIMKSVDNGATWTPITLDPLKVHTNMIGADGLPSNKEWWLPQTVSSILIHRNTYVAAHIAIDPVNPQRLYVAGRSGAWRSDDGGDHWYPAVQGLAVTINRGVLTEHSTPSNVWIGSTDWVIIKSQNRAATIIQDKPGPNTGYDLAHDRTDGRVYAAFGHRDLNQNGKVYSKLYADARWRDERIDVPPGITTLEDMFGRTTSNGWGTPDYGPAYTHNTATAFSTNNAGFVRITGSNQNYYAASAVALTDLSAYCEVSWDALAGAAASQAELTVRQVAANSFYGFRLRNTTDGNVTLVIRKVVAGTSTTLANKPGFITSYVPGEKLYLRVDCVGVSPTTLVARAWRDGEDEPDEWDLTTTDSEATLQTNGSVSVRAVADSGFAQTTNYRYDIVEFVQHGEGGSEGKRPFGVTVGRDGSNQVVVLAAVEQSGIWRKVGTGAWAVVGAPAMAGPQVAKATIFSWPWGTQYVFMYDRATGVWRSSDYGATWSQIWNSPSDAEMTGYVAASLSDPSVLWVSKIDGLYKLTNAIAGSSVGVDIPTQLITDVPRPGALTVDDVGTVYCVSKIGTGLSLGQDPGLYRSTNGGSTWQNIADTTYESIAGYPYKVTVSSDGTLYLGLNGNGVLVGIPTPDNLKRWDGSQWQPHAAKRWNGADWDIYPTKHWDGSQWR